MNRKEYIEKLEVIRAALLNLHAEFTAAAITDENPIEAARRKAAGGLFDKLNTQLYENGAVSLRIMDDNAKAGLGEQCDLFDEARRESAENGDQGEEERPAELCPHMADGVDGMTCTHPKNAGKPCNGQVAACDFRDKVGICKHYDEKTGKCVNKKANCADGICDGLNDGCDCFKAKERKAKAKGKGKKGRK